VFPVAPQPLPLAADRRIGSASGKATSPRRTRVWGFSRRPSGRRRAKRPQVAGIASGCRACDYKTVSGLGFWLSRDPIGENGGVNLYGMVFNNAVGLVDVLGSNAYPGPSGDGFGLPLPSINTVNFPVLNFPAVDVNGNVIPEFGPSTEPRPDESTTGGFGPIHKSTHTMLLCFKSASETSEAITKIYDDLKNFRHFEPNNTELVFDAGSGIKTFRIKGVIGLMNGITNDYRFSVRVSYPRNYLVRAVTLDADRSGVTGRTNGHPLIGWRTWEVKKSANDCCVRITTNAEERSRIRGNEWGRALGGASAQSRTWINYFTNIGNYWKGTKGATASAILESGQSVPAE
jgi:RHS repeat-associated protein